MKKITCIFFILSGTLGISQIILQSNTHRPAVGDTVKQFIVDTSAFTSPMPNNISGNNVTWDFSPIINTGTLNTQAFISNTAVASSTNFTGCNLVLSQGSGAYNYLKTVDTPTAQLELLGLDFGSFAKVTFTNSAVLMKYPFSYGNSFADPASGTFSANTGTSIINGSAIGNFATIADGFGTLLLGQQSIPNVLRLKSTQNFTLFQGFLPLGTIRFVIYSYYDQNNKFPLLQIQYQTFSLIAQTPSTTASVRLNSNIPLLGFNESGLPNNMVSIFPNPISEIMQLNFENLGNYILELKDINGNNIITSEINSRHYTLDVRSFADAVYLIHIKNKQTGQIYRQRMLKLSH